MNANGSLVYSKSFSVPRPRVLFEVSEGEIEVELDPNTAPMTVDNFLRYVQAGFYQDLIFHRVIPEFMIQGGDPLGRGTGGPGYRFECETKDSDRFDRPGILAMANA
ncbi:MAG: peptidylprolyl isomerase, partial [Burkholderiaceae bacterium]